MSSNNEKTALFSGVKDGELFTVAGIEFIKFPSMDGHTPAVMKNAAFLSTFGENNDLRSSVILKRLEQEVLPRIIEAVGEENVCSFSTDLTTLDGLKPYGEMQSLISVPTLEFYRKHVGIFDKYNLDDWWWLATPESAAPHSAPSWILCVAPSGIIYGYCSNRYIYTDCAVRPFCIFKSSIFDSCEE